MGYNKDFQSYYMRYLGITPQELKKGKNIYSCSQREKPLNNYYFQPLIVTNINNTKVFSISPRMYKDFTEYINNFKDISFSKIEEILKRFFDNRLENYSIRKMHRMTLNNIPTNLRLDNDVVKLTKEILMNSLKNIEPNERNKIWLRKKKEVNEGRQYVILDKDSIVSYCKVSDIDFNGGNFTVYTGEEYRNKGYGKLVSAGAIKWCNEKGVIPIYWVDKSNETSVALAKGLGFKVMSEEIVVGTKSP